MSAPAPLPGRTILFVHGRSQDGNLFAHRCAHLRAVLRKTHGAESVFVDAPFVLPLTEGQSVPMRAWVDDTGSWDQGVTVLADAVVHHQPVAIVAFSQGAALTALYLTRHPGARLDFVILAAAPNVAGLGDIAIPSLHVMGRDDRLVPLERSLAVASHFRTAAIHEHPQGHCVPQKSVDMAAFNAFVSAHLQTQVAGLDPAVLAEQLEEMDALAAIFDGNFVLLVAGEPAIECEVTVAPCILHFILPPMYPAHAAPAVKVRCPSLPRAQEQVISKDLVLHLAALADTLLGDAMIFGLADGARDWLAARFSGGTAVHVAVAADAASLPAPSMSALSDLSLELDPAVDDPLIAACTAEAAAKDAQLGRYADGRSGLARFTVGLCGKPSAGKSTFFNAAIDPIDEASGARMAAFPFTTIEPNVETGFFSTPPPKVPGGVGPVDSVWGFAAGGMHRVPVVIKDIAGLVPGAYLGRGRGNAFLSEILESDVLIHIVDASGTTDSGGNANPDGDVSPLAEVKWVREELHRWIFTNVAAKWQAIRRRPEKIHAMFSGYHAKPSAIAHAMERAGVNLAKLSEELVSWDRRTLHSVVAHFLRVRFPTLLALNKADLPSAAAHIAQLKSALPFEAMVAVSAASEWELCRLRRLRAIEYEDGASNVTVLPAGKSDSTTATVERIRRNVLQPLGSTGVLAAVTAAVNLNPPTVVFPVDDLATCVAVHVQGVARWTGSGVAAEPVAVHGSTTPEQLYHVLLHPPWGAAAGDYVRAEGLVVQQHGTGNMSITRALLRKDEPLATGAVCRIYTNRKVAWQRSAPVN